MSNATTQLGQVRVPIPFVEFCHRIGVKLRPTQQILSAVAYDNAEPSWLQGPDREVARQLFGDIETIPPAARRTIVNLCGARGGKSYVLCALRLLYLALVVNVSSLASGELASALIVAPNLKLAQQTYRFALGAAQNAPAIARRIEQVKADSFIINREGGKQVRLECLAATRGGAAIRARNYVGAALDEMCFFFSDDHIVNDVEIYNAVSPRIMKGGQLILASTAWAETGLMYEMHSTNFGHPKTCLASLAPTLLLNPDKAEEVEAERLRDPINAAREFDCVWMSSGSSAFFSGQAIVAAQDKSLMLPLSPEDYPGSEVCIGGDLGFRRDSSALVVVYRLRTGTYIVADMLEIRPQPGKPLKPSEVVAEFARVCMRHGCTWIMADGFSRDSFEEELSRHSLSYVPAPPDKGVTHMTAKVLLHGGKLRIPASGSHPSAGRLIGQFKQLIGKPTSGGGMTFSMPRAATGGHGDLLSALILAVSQKGGQVVAPPIERPKLTPEELIKKQMTTYWAQYEERMREKTEDENEALQGVWEGDGAGWGNWSGERDDEP